MTSMTARISLIQGKAGARRAPLQKTNDEAQRDSVQRFVQLSIIGGLNQPPRLRELWLLREIFLIAQPPLVSCKSLLHGSML